MRQGCSSHTASLTTSEGVSEEIVEVDMLPRRERSARSGSRETTKPTIDSEAHSVNPNARRSYL